MNSAVADEGGYEVGVALGSNEGDPPRQLKAAIAAIRRFVRVDRVSDVYLTSPVGLLDQPDFLNMVCIGRTRETPVDLLGRLHAVERAQGRTRGRRNGPRRIDLDILFYDDRVTEGPALTLPHPRMHERRFVLAPLAEIRPEWRHPVLDRTAEELLRRLPPGETARCLGDLAGLAGRPTPRAP
jgi:2-amino-4-hydroxy-6-hydroxymethyldihydropteridine diphosphokinase